MFATVRAVAAGFVVATAALVAGAAEAQTDQRWQWCQGEGGVPENVQIDACTALINSGQYGGKDLANAYYHRGVSYGQTGQYLLGCRDFTEAIRLDPTDADAYWLRHLCRKHLGDLPGALSDYLRAKRLNPRVDQRQ